MILTKNNITIILIFFVLLSAYLIIKPALSGGFYFDDAPVLAPLGIDGGIQSLSHWLHFVFSGDTGPLGRPISMASFTLDAQNWPAPAYSFKQTNLIIHLINGLLAYFLALNLLMQHPSTRQNHTQPVFVSILTMSLWLIHPLQLSTIVPIVQRMTELSAFFILLGLIYYVKQRKKLISGTFYQKITASLIILGILAALSKENGILLPLYILIIEFTFFSNFQTSPDSTSKHPFMLWKAIILFIPSIIIFLFVLYQFTKPEPPARAFTIWQHFITQPEILFSYLKLLIPQIHISGYFQDAYPFYQSLQEGSAIIYLSGMILLVALALIIRKKYPFISLAILFFFGGHILESSSIPLELYFEHRNYLPLFGIIFAFSYYVNQIPSCFIRYLTAVIIFLGISMITFYNASIWGNNLLLFTHAAQDSPHSVRAPQMAAEEWIQLKQFDKARESFQSLADQYPKQGAFPLLILQMDCLLKKDNESGYKKTLNNIKQADNMITVSQIINNFKNIISNSGCQQLNYDHLLEFLYIEEKKILTSEWKKNINQTAELENIYATLGSIFLLKNNTDAAIKNYQQAYNIMPTHDVIISLARIYINNNMHKKARQLLDNTDQKNSIEFSAKHPKISALKKELKSKAH